MGAGKGSRAGRPWGPPASHPAQDPQPWRLELMQFQAAKQGRGPLGLGCLHPRLSCGFQMSPHMGPLDIGRSESPKRPVSALSYRPHPQGERLAPPPPPAQGWDICG